MHELMGQGRQPLLPIGGEKIDSTLRHAAANKCDGRAANRLTTVWANCSTIFFARFVENDMASRLPSYIRGQVKNAGTQMTAQGLTVFRDVDRLRTVDK
jgi:hypothetical protein